MNSILYITAAITVTVENITDKRLLDIEITIHQPKNHFPWYFLAIMSGVSTVNVIFVNE